MQNRLGYGWHVRQPADLQQQLWLRFRPQPGSNETEQACEPRIVLLEAIEHLADFDRSLDPVVRMNMKDWLNGRGEFGLVEARIFEILAVDGGEIEHRWTIRYLDFLAQAPGYIHADHFRVGSALDGARSASEDAMIEWLERATHDGRWPSIALILQSVLPDRAGGPTAHVERERAIRDHRRSELMLHVMQLLAPDIFWDESGCSWAGRRYPSVDAAISDYPYFGLDNIASLVDRGVISDAEAAELAQLGPLEEMISGCNAERSHSDVAAEARRILGAKLGSEGLFATLFALRDSALRLRRGEVTSTDR